MTQRRPIVLVGGLLAELPVGDVAVGAVPDFDSLPLATLAVPQEFIVKQAGVWVRATYAQMQTWFPSGGGMTNPVTVDGANVTVNGEQVYVNGGAAPGPTGVTVNSEQIFVNSELVVINGT